MNLDDLRWSTGPVGHCVRLWRGRPGPEVGGWGHGGVRSPSGDDERVSICCRAVSSCCESPLGVLSARPAAPVTPLVSLFLFYVVEECELHFEALLSSEHNAREHRKRVLCYAPQCMGTVSPRWRTPWTIA